MAANDSVITYLHYRWTMPSGGPIGLAEEPLEFSVIAAEMYLTDAPEYIKGLRGVLDGRNLEILGQAAQNLLTDSRYGPQHKHVIAFASARTADYLVLQLGATTIFFLLERRWSGKTLSVIPVPFDLFANIEEVATKYGFSSTPPPSLN